MIIRLDVTPEQLELIIGAMNDILATVFLIVILTILPILFYLYSKYEKNLEHELDMIRAKNIWED